MRLIYSTFQHTPEGRPLSERVKDMKKATEWFEQELEPTSRVFTKLTSPVMEMIQTTLKSLQKLEEWNKSNNIVPMNIAWISTLIIENFFGIIHFETLYPSLKQFAEIHNAAYRELIKRLIPGFTVPQFATGIGKAYALIQGLEFTVEDLDLYTPFVKAMELQLERVQNIISVDTESVGKYINVNGSYLNPITRKSLTLRQSTCKTKFGVSYGLLPCPNSSCSEIFVYRKVYERHIRAVSASFNHNYCSYDNDCNCNSNYCCHQHHNYCNCQHDCNFQHYNYCHSSRQYCC